MEWRPDAIVLAGDDSGKFRRIFAFARHAADAWGRASADPAPNFVECLCVRQEPGMARRSIVWLPLASVGRLFICASWQLRPGGCLNCGKPR